MNIPQQPTPSSPSSVPRPVRSPNPGGKGVVIESSVKSPATRFVRRNWLWQIIRVARGGRILGRLSFSREDACCIFGSTIEPAESGCSPKLGIKIRDQGIDPIHARLELPNPKDADARAIGGLVLVCVAKSAGAKPVAVNGKIISTGESAAVVPAKDVISIGDKLFMLRAWDEDVDPFPRGDVRFYVYHREDEEGSKKTFSANRLVFAACEDTLKVAETPVFPGRDLWVWRSGPRQFCVRMIHPGMESAVQFSVERGVEWKLGTSLYGIEATEFVPPLSSDVLSPSF